MKSSTDCLWLTRYLLLHPRDRNSIQVICNERYSLFLQFLNQWSAHQMFSRILFTWILNCLFVISFWWKCLAFFFNWHSFCIFWFSNKNLFWGDQNKQQICWKNSGFVKTRFVKPSVEQITRFLPGFLICIDEFFEIIWPHCVRLIFVAD